ncbi:MFS transporter [Paracoccus aminophilus]|uniref:Major facilitator superfamily transport protein n=1 Tax=Paracoccus aminophilus JCM 7686 TaxID=1367847 RepID=S5XX29_PARAH|nr:MFS transporter [Paracoccus aminophilus]AGT09872.1 major facilitator superfamily transport protein [Paracoccus aminophilus JCM 7686]
MTSLPRSFIGRRRALSGCFLAGGIGIGTWGANLPALSRRADISEAEIGVVLLCFAAGAILAMVNAPGLILRTGAGRLAAIAAALFGLTIIAVSLVHAMWVAALIAVCCGLSFGTLDVTMNKEAAALEGRAGKPIMASFHAIFSGGTLFSAALYAALIQLGANVFLCLTVAGVTITTIALLAMRGLPPELPEGPVVKAPQAVSGQARTSARASQLRMLILGGMAFLAFFAEGTILDWIAVYMVRSLGTGDSLGAFSYAIFAGAMTLGRLVGDRINAVLGPVTLFRFGTFAVALSMAVALSVSSIPVILVALAICGFGAANIIPVIFSEAGRLGNADGGKTMSRVLTMGYAGILIGPALIGFVAEHATLRLGLSIVIIAMIAIGFCGRFVQGNR